VAERENGIVISHRKLCAISDSTIEETSGVSWEAKVLRRQRQLAEISRKACTFTGTAVNRLLTSTYHLFY
jgi:hypothetical protein